MTSSPSAPAPSAPLAPPFSPVLLAGLALRPVPPALIRPLLRGAMRLMLRRHPAMFERLDVLEGALVVIDPIDLPFTLALSFGQGSATLDLASAEDRVAARATVRGPLLVLIDLMEGRLDGDALFFSRELAVEGSTEAVVALRNAMDGEEIRIKDDLLEALGPLAAPARRLAGPLAWLAGRMSADLETLRAALLAPALKRAETQGAEIRRLGERLGQVERKMPRRAAKQEQV